MYTSTAAGSSCLSNQTQATVSFSQLCSPWNYILLFVCSSAAVSIARAMLYVTANGWMMSCWSITIFVMSIQIFHRTVLADLMAVTVLNLIVIALTVFYNADVVLIRAMIVIRSTRYETDIINRHSMPKIPRFHWPRRWLLVIFWRVTRGNTENNNFEKSQ